MPVITRFAPSPTGDLHIGGVRTALFAWLYARHTSGKAVLRIEDTDVERSTKASVEGILEGLSWLGIEWDGDVVYQAQRFSRYKEVISQLVEEKKAYRCYCSKERLVKLREEQIEQKIKARYDGCCRDLAEEKPGPFVIRFRQSHVGETTFTDLVRGEISVQHSELDDLIIARSDGTPTYNLTVVVDDSEMGVTHVIRGDDHINNTPRQLNIFHALGAPLPQYAHVPMILGPDGKRLSKRHGAASVLAYRDEGYLPQALLNYLVRLGWSHGDQEIFARDEMIALFDFGGLSKSAAAINPEKLQWLNQHYLKTLAPESLLEEFKWHLSKIGYTHKNDATLIAIIVAQCERVKTLKEMAERSAYFFEEFEDYDAKAAKKAFNTTALVPLNAVIEVYQALADWEAEPVHEVILATAEKLDLKLGKVAQPIRVAVTGGGASPPLDVTLVILGKEVVVKRLLRARDFITQLLDE
jgi:glutamyl-tRNA synthetase